jgi:short-subunit dehydrogenase
MPTALITGASAGLGVEYARQLAARGHDLVLVARRIERMEELAATLPGQPVVIGHDLAADAGAGLPDKVAEAGAQVDLLVNNAGVGTYGRVWQIEEDLDAAMVRLNCEAVVVLTRAFLPAMIERSSGGVIVTASTAGMQPIPYEATYAASKAFALSFTEGLAGELRGTGVRAMAVNPGPVPTEWQEVAGIDDTGMVPGEITADQCVREALDAWEAGRRSIIPGRLMRWVMRGSRLGPRALQLRVTERLYRP